MEATLTTDVRDMALEFPAGLRSSLDATLQLDVMSTPEQPALSGRLSGTVDVTRGAYREPLAVAAGALAALRAPASPVGPGAVEPDSLARRLALDVRVRTGDDLVVDNNYARLQIGADLAVGGTPAAPGLTVSGMPVERTASRNCAAKAVVSGKR